jgi:hypothetical protein
VFDAELQSLGRLLPTRPPDEAWARMLLLLGRAVRSGTTPEEMKRLTRRTAPFPRPVVILAGDASPAVEEKMNPYLACLAPAFEGFGGTLISGGTTAGVPGMAGKIAEMLRAGGGNARVVGYLPRLTRPGAPSDSRYDEFCETEGTDFSPLEPLQYWVDLITAGVPPPAVRLLGIGGGRIAAVEYRLALALGATVGVVESSGRSATALLQDPDWVPAANLLCIPLDAMALRAFVNPGTSRIPPDLLDRAAQAVHLGFLKDNRYQKLDPSMMPWEHLREDYRESNRQQVAYAEAALQKAGYGVRQAAGEIRYPEFTDLDVETMAEMEHGRWVVERLKQGWRYGPSRDPDRKLSPYLVAWKSLPEGVREWDRDAVRSYPQVLKAAGLEVYKKDVGRDR